MIPASDLRARFAVALSAMYGREVPAYTTLVEVATAVNADVVAREGAEAERLGTLTSDGAVDTDAEGTNWSAESLSEALGMPIADPYDLYDAQVAAGSGDSGA
ncbi:DUF1338 family protein [Rhodococcus sp. BP-241]|uniref:2-oxoadipate dioxygenase/decarboxylase family protein n=1 Tax=Rhodococcus sp. BP-241 TaxID=2739441 RepID=UPI001C9AB9E4|nr:DUF1338 family protein [Rhodococcus sp. BP-241]MBY6707666.1 DUF1338 family protein [Rhodococcus sp. BP-241]